MRSGSHPSVAGGERDPSSRWAGDEGFGDARSSPLSRGALGRQKGCPVVAPWVAASPPAWLLCPTCSQPCTCGENPIISLRNNHFANHSHSPCQGTARLGDVTHSPRVSAAPPRTHRGHPHPRASTLHFFGVCCVIFKHILSFSSNGMCVAQTQSKSQLPPWRCLAVNSQRVEAGVGA